MRKYLLGLSIIALSLGVARAQDLTLVTATTIVDAGGNRQLLASGTIHFLPTDGKGHLLSFKLGSGGIVPPVSADCLIVNGAITGASTGDDCKLANTETTNPQHVCYSISLENNLTGTLLPLPGYQCYQPKGITDNLDNFVPSQDYTAPTTPIGGAVGPAGPGTINGLRSDGSNGIIVDGTIHGTTNGNSPMTGVWQRNGTVMIGNLAEEFVAQEPIIMYNGSQFQMWYTCGWGHPGLCYAISTDGMNFARQNGALPVLANVFHAFIIRNGSTYYFYGVQPDAPWGFVRYTSPDGIAWTQDGTQILGRPGGWDYQSKGNISVWIENGTWYALYEAAGTDGIWRTGEASSSDGLTWTPYAGNPVITMGGYTGAAYASGGGCGGPDVHKVGAMYYAWIHCSPIGANLPTDIYRVQSTDKVTWTAPVTPALTRMTVDEGPGPVAEAQIADPMLVEVAGSTYMYYSATSTQNPGPYSAMHIKLAVAPMTIAKLVTTTEGNGGSLGPEGVAFGLPLFGYGGPAWSLDQLQVPVVPPIGRWDVGLQSEDVQAGVVIEHTFNGYRLPNGGMTSLIAGYGGRTFFDIRDGSYHFQSTATSQAAGVNQPVNDILVVDKGGNATFSGSVTANSGVSPDSSWSQTTPVVTCQTGSGTLSATVRTNTIGKQAAVNIVVSDTSNGTCAGGLIIPIPFTVKSASTLACNSYIPPNVVESFANANAVTTSFTISKYDGTTIAGTGNNASCNGVVEIQ